jgi:predicted nucleic acid-binding protein
MNRVVVDASALAAVAFNEPGADEVARRLDGALVSAPVLLKFELANVAWKKIRRQPEQNRQILRALSEILGPRTGIRWMEVDPADVVMLSLATGLTAYDAAYVWLAGMLGADIVTLDVKIERATSNRAILRSCDLAQCEVESTKCCRVLSLEP